MTAYEYLRSKVAGELGEECMEWPYQKDKDGYGRLRIPLAIAGKRIKVAAHRLAFKFVRGRWPMPNGLHTCDNPSCFNPKHIYEGTIQENHNDQKSRRRTVRGTGQSQAKLTEEIVLEARREYRETGIGCYRLAKKYGVSHPTMASAIKGVCGWKHVPNQVGQLRKGKGAIK